MTNIDELVKALRICNNPKGHRCSECPVFSRYPNRVCKSMVDKQSADAIEALQKQLIDYNHMSKLVDGKMSENQRLRRINEALQAENISLRAERDQARLDCAIAETNHMNTLARLLDAQERITELTAERDALLKAVEKPSVQERGD